MPKIVNNLIVSNTNSKGENQTFSFDISNPSWIFSYAGSEAEGGILRKGGGYVFTLTFGNMGYCVGESFVSDTLSVDDIGGIQLKLMDVFRNNNGYIPYFIGLFYYPEEDRYLNWGFTIDEILENNLNLVICPNVNMNILLYDGEYETFYLKIDSNTIENLGLLFQVEDIFCDNCTRINKLQESITLVGSDFNLESEELNFKLKEIKEKYRKNFKKIK